MFIITGIILGIGMGCYTLIRGFQYWVMGLTLFFGLLSSIPGAVKAHKEVPRAKYTGPKVGYGKNIFMAVVLLPFSLILGPVGFVLWLWLFISLIKDIRRVNCERCN